MAPSQAPQSRAVSNGPGAQPVAFRFPVTWTYLAEPLRFVKTEAKSRLQPAVLPLATTHSGPSGSTVMPCDPPLREVVSFPAILRPFANRRGYRDNSLLAVLAVGSFALEA